MKITFAPIGYVHSPFQTVDNMPIQPPGAADAKGTVEVLDDFRPGLRDLEGFSHLVLLYYFHRSKGFDLQVVPFLDDSSRGVFATRAPRRPNAIGLSIVHLTGMEGGTLHIRGVDVLDGTPLLDIKPYVPRFDAPANVRTGWLEKHQHDVSSKRSDRRFHR